MRPTRWCAMALAAVALGSLVLWQTTRSVPPTAAATSDLVPRLLSLRYGTFRPPGAEKAAHELKLRAQALNGQIIGVDVTTDRGAVKADGACGLGGRRNGQAATDYLPMTLTPGPHRVRVALTSSHCRGTQPGPLHHSSSTRTLHVPAR